MKIKHSLNHKANFQQVSKNEYFLDQHCPIKWMWAIGVFFEFSSSHIKEEQKETSEIHFT